MVRVHRVSDGLVGVELFRIGKCVGPVYGPARGWARLLSGGLELLKTGWCMVLVHRVVII